MRHSVRYDTPDENGVTRRERNARFDEPTPEIEIPESAQHVWEWFWDLSARRRSGPEALSYGEVGEWQRLTASPVRPEEIEMLMAMDNAFLKEARKEQRLQFERAREQAKVNK